jgi:RpiR family glv operon transcriptional regulator
LSGDIREVEKEMGILKLKGIPIVSITSLSNNSLASLGRYNLYFQSTPIMQGDTEIVCFLPIHLTLDSLYRKYVDYTNRLLK